MKSIIQMLKAWSFSRFNTYDQCAYKARRLYIDKVPMLTNDAMARGLRVHKLGEDYLKGKLKAVPEEYSKFKDLIRELKRQGAVAEEQWTFTNEWWPTGWFDPDAWLRIKIDAQLLTGTHLDIYDWKTGKKRDGYEEQLDLYAAGAFALYDGLETAKTHLIYLDSGETATADYTASQAKVLIKFWNNKTKPMLADKKFLANPTWLCNYCQFSKKVGGGCKW